MDCEEESEAEFDSERARTEGDEVDEDFVSLFISCRSNFDRRCFQTVTLHCSGWALSQNR